MGSRVRVPYAPPIALQFWYCKAIFLLKSDYEKDLTGLHEGDQLQFEVNGLGHTHFHATLISIGQQVDETNRSIELLGRVKESHPQFRPGMYVSAKLETER